jgi:hypothetical protein
LARAGERYIGYEGTDIVENIVSSENDVALLGHFPAALKCAMTVPEFRQAIFLFWQHRDVFPLHIAREVSPLAECFDQLGGVCSSDPGGFDRKLLSTEENQ